MAAENPDDLFGTCASTDFLGFEFNGRAYSEQIKDAIHKTGKLCAVTCTVREINGHRVVWLAHDFGFLGGSLGCAEGEKLVLGFERAREERMPVVVECRSGGARMQEGTLALMQLAKVSVAVQALQNEGLPFIAVNLDPTYGGVSASYAMQGDVRIGITGARIGFAGPAVILNTMYEMDQGRYDAECPEGFQSAEYLHKHGQLDIVLESEEELEPTVGSLLDVLMNDTAFPVDVPDKPEVAPTEREPDYQLSRGLDRYQAEDIINRVFTDYVALSGDGRVGSDCCIRGGLAKFQGRSVMVIATFKGHDPVSMKESNFGMASPHGYRFALRLMQMAEHYGFPVVTLVDTPGAWPSFISEEVGQSEALATNLKAMAALTVPIVSMVVGEGGSGGALGIALANRVAMLSRAYYAVISPEGAASILGRYTDADHKAVQFPEDCKALAKIQKVYAPDLLALGVIDTIIEEDDEANYENCDGVMGRISHFLASELNSLSELSANVLVSERYSKFRTMGKVDSVSNEERAAILSTPREVKARTKRSLSIQPTPSGTLNYIADRVLNSENSAFLGKAPADMNIPAPLPAPPAIPEGIVTAKTILDAEGPDAVVAWVKEQSPNRVLITDTTMRDAHQSLLATRVRTTDLLAAADEAAYRLRDAFSFEMWGGATFDVAYRFLHESPWDRLRALRERIPNTLFQMLLRGSNAVGYTSYPDNVVVAFVKAAAEAGIDVFRIFDCFNDLDQMQLSIDAVRECGKIAEVCLCFTGNFLSPHEKIYTLDYYKDLAERFTAAGAHMLAIKDMAGLLRPQMAAPLVEAIRSVTDLPIHYHTHSTSSASFATCLNMAAAGCDIIDFCTASMADTTSQPSLNAFLAAMEGDARDPKIDWLSLEPLDNYWASVRSVYSPFESGLKAGSARVYDHQIPGGQYSNLFAQCKSMGLMNRWPEVLDMYRDVNKMLGDIVKVTPSSKCVGDLALFLVTRGLTTTDVIESGADIEYPDSIISLFMGKLGRPHHGLPKALENNVLKGATPLSDRPGAVMPAVDFVAEKARLEAKYVTKLNEEEVVSALLYPKVYDDYRAWLGKYGDKVQYLPSQVFFYGMELGEEIETVRPSESGSSVVSIRLKRVGPLQMGGMRTCIFEVNGEKRSATVKDESNATAGSDLPKADPNNPHELGAPMPGTVDKVLVVQGQTLFQGDQILVVSAMKMEVIVSAPYDCMVVSMCVQEGDKVDQGTLLATLEVNETSGGSQGFQRIDSLAVNLSEMGNQ